MQYMKADFGGPAPLSELEIVIAEPADACSPLLNAELAAGKMVLAHRGTCTYGTKGTTVQAAGAAGLLIINTEDGILHPPGPDAQELTLFTAMIAQDAGAALINHIQHTGTSSTKPQTGRVVPINCFKGGYQGPGAVLEAAPSQNDAQCQPATKAERCAVHHVPSIYAALS